MAIQYTLIAIGDVILQSAVNLLGTKVMAAVSVVSRILYLAAQPLEAMGVTMGTYCAQNRGINDLGRIRKGIRTGGVMCLFYVAVMNLLLHMVLPYVVPLFMDGEATEVLGYVRRYILICGPCYVFVAFILIFRNGLQGCGFGWIPVVGVVIEVSARSGVTIVLGGRGGLEGICAAHCTAWISSGLSFVLLYMVLMRRMGQAKRE